MIDETAAMCAWLAAHDLAEAELLHSLPNYGPEGADQMTGPERLVLSALLETRRAVIPGYQPTPTRRPTMQDRVNQAELVGLFDPDCTRPPQGATVEPAGHHSRLADSGADRNRPRLSAGLRREQRQRDEERER
jgi:hypothetical protein